MTDSIVRVCIIAVISSVLTLALKKDRPEFSAVIAISAGVIILLNLLPAMGNAARMFINIAEIAGVGGEYVTVIVKSCAVATMTGICASTCRDSDNSSLALKLEIAGRVAIIILAMPVINTLLNVILSVIK